MDRYFDLEHRVDDSEIDAQQHVHNLRYLQWTLWAAGEHTRVGGWDAKAALEKGLGWVVRSHDITYRDAAIAGDELKSELGSARFPVLHPSENMRSVAHATKRFSLAWRLAGFTSIFGSTRCLQFLTSYWGSC